MQECTHLSNYPDAEMCLSAHALRVSIFTIEDEIV
ncbi:hypothetical protein VQ7734_05080 [Vibrio quintilis]|uniref:Uncharacterized protein n=1 Tax=Vibrio quintilis TaxID=1117707 RepID=A0A1M7Z3D4_9VIBR|nr:hypothetical protein VQ7734_05080 [Vibrio quintilis]